jgi:hypothetical protein
MWRHETLGLAGVKPETCDQVVDSQTSVALNADKQAVPIGNSMKTS